MRDRVSGVRATVRADGFRALAALAALALTASCSLAFKTGVHDWSGDDLEESRSGATLEVTEIEAGLGAWPKQHLDLAFAADFVNAPDGTDFLDLRLTSRYAMRQGKRFSPVLGGGIGWYRWDVGEPFAVAPPFCIVEGTLITECEILGTEDATLAQGYYPHVVGGVNMKVSRLVDLVLEDRYDFSKEEGPFDFESNQILFGVRLLWDRRSP